MIQKRKIIMTMTDAFKIDFVILIIYFGCIIMIDLNRNHKNT